MNDESSHRERANAMVNLAQIRARVLKQARDTPSPTRAQHRKQVRAVVWAAIVVVLLLFLASGGVRSAPRPDRLVFTTSVGSGFIALIAGGIALSQARSMLGRAASRLLAVALVTPALLFAWKVLASSRTPNMMLEWSARPGFRCLGLSIVLGLAPLVGVMWIRRGCELTHPCLAGAGIGATVGAGVWVLVDLWCPVGYVPHLLLGHVLPLVLVIGASALVGGRTLALHGQLEQ